MEKPQAPPVGTPNYEEYIQLATQNKWNPVDPVAKLEDTIKRYPLVSKLHFFSSELTLVLDI